MSYSSDSVKKWRQRTKQKMVEAMGGECQCCGYNTTTAALAFHHLDPKVKDLGFGHTRANPCNWDKVVEELRKCILVCHNCHAEIHWGLREVPEDAELFNEDFADWRKVEELDECPVCKQDKPARQRFCSHKCAQTNRRKVDWDSIDLIKLLEEYSISDLEQKLGVSNSAIYKRRDKILGR